jgi:hypothetical protein
VSGEQALGSLAVELAKCNHRRARSTVGYESATAPKTLSFLAFFTYLVF